MRRPSLRAAVIALALVAAATAALSSAAPSSTSAKPSVAALFPGLIDDHSWNQAGYDGLKKAKAMGIKTAYIENVSQDKQLEAFQNFARQGYQIVIGHGGEYMDSALRAAKKFPKTKFVVINGNKAGGNVSSVSLNYGDMGYISGALGAAMSKSGKLGVVAGEHIPIVDDGIKGLKDGAARVNKKVQVKSTILQSWTDVAKAREASLALINSGVDILWPFLDAAETGVISAAEDQHVMSMAVYHDIRKLAPKSYIGGAWADPAIALFDAATKASLLNGKVHPLGAKEGVVVLAPFGKGVPAKAKAATTAAYKALKSGTHF
jgi:basic membrane protein A and related proteins